MGSEPEYFSQQVREARRWFLAWPGTRETGLVTVSVGCERCLPDYVVQRETFDLQALEFVAEGQGRLILGGETLELRPGTLFSYGPGIPHRIENHSRHPMLKYFLDVGGQHAESLFPKAGSPIERRIQVGDLSEMVEMFEAILKQASRNSGQVQRVCSLLAEALLVRVQEEAMRPRTRDPRARATYERVRRHLQDHYLTLKSIRQLAHETHLDMAYLSRLFRRFHGSSPYQHLMQLKMSHAASLFLNSGMLVKEVADVLEFPDAFQFSKCFKRIHGISPDQFMRRPGRD